MGKRLNKDLILTIVLVALIPVLIILYLLYSFNLSYGIFLSPAESSIFKISFDDGTANDFFGINNGSLNNEAQIIDDNFRGKVLYLNGSQYVNISHGTGDLDFGLEDFSVSVWAKPESIDNSFIFDKGYSSTGYSLYISENYGTSFIIRLNDIDLSGCSFSKGNNNWVEGGWHNLVAVVNRIDGTMSCYLDGSFTGGRWSFINPTQNISSANNLSIGSNSAGNSFFFNGSIDELVIYNTTLSSEEISQMFLEQGGCNQDSDCSSGKSCIYRTCRDDLRLNLTFDDVTAITIPDNSNYHNNAYLIDGAQIIDNIKGNSLYLNGTTHATVPDPIDGSLDFKNTSFSVLVWVNATNESSFILDKGYWSSGYSLYITESKGTAFYLSKIGETNFTGCYFSTNNSWIDGKWHHLAVVVDRAGGAINCYFDGTFTSSQWNPLLITDDISSSSNFQIGISNALNSPYNGSIDDVKIYGRALSASEIVGEMSGFCGDESCSSSQGETCSNCARDCGACPPNNPDNDNNPNNNPGSTSCTSSWNCTSWSSCIDNNQTRNCTNLSNCNSIVGKPLEKQSCTISRNCVDNDLDGYGVGADCLGIDLDDNNMTINTSLSAGGNQKRDFNNGKTLFFLLIGTLILILIILSILIIRYIKNNKKPQEMNYGITRRFVEDSKRKTFENYSSNN